MVSDPLNTATFMLKFKVSVVLSSRASVVHAQAPSRFLKQRADLTRVRGITMSKSVFAAVAVLAACDKPAPVVAPAPSPPPPVVVTPTPPPAPAPGADAMKSADKAMDAAKDAKGSAMDAKDAAKDSKDAAKDSKD